MPRRRGRTIQRIGASSMSGPWMSSVRSNFEIGMKQGTRTKYYGHDWNPADFKIPVEPDEVHAAARKLSRGYPLRREEFPEAEAVWNEKKFSKVGEILYGGCFLAVRGNLAAILSRFDLGEGGLVPFPIYKADLVTPYGGDFFLLNLGARKNTILPEKCEDATKFYVDKDTKQQIWHINDFVRGGKSCFPLALLKGRICGLKKLSITRFS